MTGQTFLKIDKIEQTIEVFYMPQTRLIHGMFVHPHEGINPLIKMLYCLRRLAVVIGALVVNALEQTVHSRLP